MARAAAADAMLGSVGNGALGRLPSGPALGLEPPGSRRAGPQDAAPRAGSGDGDCGLDLASSPKLWGARTRVPRSCVLKTLHGLGVRGTL